MLRKSVGNRHACAIIPQTAEAPRPATPATPATRAFIFFVAVSLPWLGYEACAAAELRVRPDGAADAAKMSLSTALAIAMPGDTIVLEPGIYERRIRTRRSGAPGAPIIVRGLGKVTVQAAGNVLTIEHDHYRFEDLTFDGAMGLGETVLARGVEGLTLRRVQVRHSGKDCVDIRGRRIEIDSSEIHSCLRKDLVSGETIDAHGITGAVDGLVIKNTSISYFSGDGIQLSPSRSSWDNVLVENVRIWIGPLPRDLGAFRAGEVVGENAFDSKVGKEGPPSRIRFRNVVAHGFKGYITNQAAFNIKERVHLVVDGARVYRNELAFRIRRPARVLLRNVVTYENGHSLRLEGGIEDLTIQNNTFADRLFYRYGGGGSPVRVVAKNNLLLTEHPLPPFMSSKDANLRARPEDFISARDHDYRLRSGYAGAGARSAGPAKKAGHPQFPNEPKAGHP